MSERGGPRSYSTRASRQMVQDACSMLLSTQAWNTQIKLLSRLFPSPEELVSVPWNQELGQGILETGEAERDRGEKEGPWRERCMVFPGAKQHANLHSSSATSWTCTQVPALPGYLEKEGLGGGLLLPSPEIPG